MDSTRHQFVHHNSFESLPSEDESIDLIVTSPPYPMIEMWDGIFGQYDEEIEVSITQGDGKQAFERMHSLLDRTWAECFRVLKNGGFAAINIGDATRTLKGRFQLYSNHSRIIRSFEKLGFDTLPCIIWRKPTNSPTKFMGSGMLPAGAYVTLEHEHILIFRKGTKRAFGTKEKVIRKQSALFWEERNTWFSDQWEILGTRQNLDMKSERKRAAAFPIEIASRLILMYSAYQDTIMDPFSGTGTTTLSSIAHGRNSIAIDSDEMLLAASLHTPTKHRTKSQLNDILLKRAHDHWSYVGSKDMLFFRYRNENHGFPVKTLQEKELVLKVIKSLTKTDNLVTANYRKLKKEEYLKSSAG